MAPATVVLLFAGAGFAHEPPGSSRATDTANSPEESMPLFQGLGDHEFPISTSSERAQAYFNQGLTFIYGFNHFEAQRSFAAAARLDPTCAMCYWGLALALGPHINAPMTPEAGPAAVEAMRQATRFAPNASAREQGYITALSARYAADPTADRTGLDRAYAEAMRELVAAHPADLDAAVLFAESLMNLVPWNYWSAEGEPRPETVELLAALESVLERAPDHAGALHYYIHAIENSPDPARAEDAADRLRALNIAIGHMIHMPSHIYARVGRWHDASAANEGALEDDRAYLGAHQAEGMVPVLYHPHNYHFLSWTAGMEGRSAVAVRAADALLAATQAELAAQVPFLNNFLTAPALTRVRFARWDEILAAPRPPGDAPFRVAIDHYARGLAYAGTGSLEEARREAAALAAIARGDDVTSLEQPEAFFPGATILGIADRVLNAELALAAGDAKASVRLLEEAVALQDGLAYMEPPYWPASVRPALGRALMRVGEPTEAERVYREDLAQYPNNGWALAGLETSLRAQGRIPEADEASGLFASAWSRADTASTGQ